VACPRSSHRLWLSPAAGQGHTQTQQRQTCPRPGPTQTHHNSARVHMGQRAVKSHRLGNVGSTEVPLRLRQHVASGGLGRCRARCSRATLVENTAASLGVIGPRIILCEGFLCPSSPCIAATAATATAATIQQVTMCMRACLMRGTRNGWHGWIRKQRKNNNGKAHKSKQVERQRTTSELPHFNGQFARFLLSENALHRITSSPHLGDNLRCDENQTSVCKAPGSWQVFRS